MISTESRFLCRMDSLAFALRAAIKVAGKDELAYIRLYRLNENTLSISALGEDAAFRAQLRVDFIHWNDDRDDRVALSKHAAASLAGFEVKTPHGLDVEPTVSVNIGPERIRVQDESGLFQAAGGRDEHRLADPILPGDHEKLFFDAAAEPGAPFWITPEVLSTIAGVTKLLHRRILMLRRLEPDEAVSRWYVVGDGWQMTVSKKEKHRLFATINQDEPQDQDEEEPSLEPRRVLALPAGGLA